MQLRPYQNDLVEQVRTAWRQGSKSPCIVLPCGGGKSCIVAEMARRTTFRGKRVLFLVHRRELCEQIENTFRRWGVDMSLCRVMMVQTATRRLAKLPRPALIITDENHHSLAKTYRRIYDHFADVPRVGVTATPVRLNGEGLGDVNDRLIVGVSAKQLIEMKCLAPYDYYAPSIADLTGLHTRAGEYVAGDIEKAMMKSTVYGDAIKYYRELANGRKAICYCASVKHSLRCAEEFRAAGIAAAHIDGNTPKPERARIISDFRAGEIRILCNVDLISEGFDVPDCECSILMRPTRSLTLYIQQSMRCMRYREGKRAVIIDHAGNYARFGMPDDDRKWSLESKPREKRERPETAAGVKQCPECFCVFHPPEGEKEYECPMCGYLFEKKSRTLEEDKDAGLVKIEGFKLDLRTPADCHTYAELLEYAKAKGYKAGWAWYQAKARGLIA